MKGKVYIIGAGPGNSDLITLKGYRIIQEADVIIYDYLIDPLLIRQLKPGAKIISCESLYSPSQHEKRSQDPEKVNRLLIKYALAGKLVARLKTGDPFIFGRTGQEIEALAKNEIEYEVIPGVSAAQAAAAYSGIPLTDNNSSAACIFVSGKDVSDSQSTLVNWETVACQNTIAVYMTVSNLKTITQKLITSGKPPQTPAALVQNASLPNQKTIISTLKNISSEAQKQKIKAPAILIAGNTVRHEKNYNWLKKNRKILYTGFSAPCYHQQGTYYHMPLISTQLLSDYTDFDRHIKSIKNYAWLIFREDYLVKYFFERLFYLGLDSRHLAGLQVAALHTSVQKQLLQYGITADFIPQNNSFYCFPEKFGKVSSNKSSVLLPCAENYNNNIMTKKLKESGVIADKIAVCRKITVTNLPELDMSFFDEIVFTSPLEVRFFAKRYTSVPGNLKIIGKGNNTLKSLKKYKLQ